VDLHQRDWDGLHLSTGGLVTTFAARPRAAGCAALAGWDAESTAWRRWVFVDAERLPDLTA
jgi:hypothetical protein